MHVSNKHKSLRSHLFFSALGILIYIIRHRVLLAGSSTFFLHQNERKHEISQLQLTACQHERAQPPLPPPPLPSSPDRCELSPLQEYDLFPLYYARLVSALRKCPTNASGAGVSPCAHRVGGFESLLKQT